MIVALGTARNIGMVHGGTTLVTTAILMAITPTRMAGQCNGGTKSTRPAGICRAEQCTCGFLK